MYRFREILAYVLGVAYVSGLTYLAIQFAN